MWSSYKVNSEVRETQEQKWRKELECFQGHLPVLIGALDGGGKREKRGEKER